MIPNMRFFILLFSVITLVSCKVKNEVIRFQDELEFGGYCPDDGTCTFSVLSQKVLKVKKDNLGAIYPAIAEGNKIVLKFEYSRNEKPNVADASYKEQVFIELSVDQLEIETEVLKHVNILFARLCYCKGLTGYYRVRTGKLAIKKLLGETYNISLKFEVTEVPQVVTQIEQIFSLSS